MIEWTPQLATGDPEIDRQHRELFARINRLLSACQRGSARTEITRLIGFLEVYVIEHFGFEEQAMILAAYPSLEEHRRQHDFFRRSFATLKTDALTQGSTVAVTLEMNRLLVRWLVHHVEKVDRALARGLARRTV
ncbi:MAG: hemerythrin family protein [Polyangiaceae bacterium]|nr:hemerythrin family protein [Polyangiaceae bacterium]